MLAHAQAVDTRPSSLLPRSLGTRLRIWLVFTIKLMCKEFCEVCAVSELGVSQLVLVLSLSNIHQNSYVGGFQLFTNLPINFVSGNKLGNSGVKSLIVICTRR